jgi:hypothetical protein
MPAPLGLADEAAVLSESAKRIELDTLDFGFGAHLLHASVSSVVNSAAVRVVPTAHKSTAVTHAV